MATTLDLVLVLAEPITNKGTKKSRRRLTADDLLGAEDTVGPSAP